MNSIIFKVSRLASRLSRKALACIPNPVRDEREALLETIVSRGIPAVIGFDQERFKSKVLSFVESMKCGAFEYRYSPSAPHPTLYSSVYACLLYSLFGEMNNVSLEQRRQWAGYFDSFQSSTDGLFRDPAVQNEIYEDSDWWGARHLVLHLITAYAALDQLPQHRFAFLDAFKSPGRIDEWLDSVDWSSPSLMRSDIDNKVMNVACALQFERDYHNDIAARCAVEHLHNRLETFADARTGLWGSVDFADANSLSRAVQFAYHLRVPMLYDGRKGPGVTGLLEAILCTQNAVGGYGTQLNSSACEDIDSVDLLCKLSEQIDARDERVALSLERSLPWQLANQNDDGGFVFRRNEALTYGHRLMSSGRNESALFPTWFRSLSVCYTANKLGKASFVIGRQPGLQFWGTPAGGRLHET